MVEAPAASATAWTITQPPNVVPLGKLKNLAFFPYSFFAQPYFLSEALLPKLCHPQSSHDFYMTSFI